MEIHYFLPVILLFNTEYGITDRLQNEVSIPHQTTPYIIDTAPNSHNVGNDRAIQDNSIHLKIQFEF